jgi:uncharacterized membrane protein
MAHPDEDANLAAKSPVEQNVESVLAFNRREAESVTRAQRRVERLGQILIRPEYLLTLLLAIGVWVGFNLGAEALGHRSWDGPPFALLDTIMTFASLLTTTVVLIAQNRQSKREQQHAHLDLQVNLITEQKVSKLIHLIEELRHDLPMVKERHDPEVEALQVQTNAEKVLTTIEEKGLATAHDVGSDDERRG